MSLSLEPVETSKLIANIYTDKKLSGHVYYDSANDIEDEKALTRIRLNNKNEMFFPSIMDFEKCEQVDTIYISGSTGCGKSSFVRNYCVSFKQKYPKAKIYLFSSKKVDKALDDLNIERMNITNDILLNPFTLKELSLKSKPSLAIFDDCEDFENKKITAEIERFRNEVMRNGRSYGIFCIMTHHNPCEYVKTRNMLFEASKIVIFPRQCGKNTYDYLLEKYCHLKKKNINLINKSQSNFVVYNKKIPNFILSDKYIILE